MALFPYRIYDGYERYGKVGMMKDKVTNHSVLVITGMHRSGTSLTTSLLESAGVHIGDRLMDAGTGNTKGHFEDLDFVDLHRQALTAQGINREGWTTVGNLTFEAEYLQQAKAAIAARNQRLVWGWKDPRTTLFLNCWQELIPQAKFIFVYRSPWDVVDSLFRRGDSIFKTNPEIAIQTWVSYNQAIVNFCQQTNRPWILLRIEDVINHPQFIINAINHRLELELQSPQSIYDRSLFTNNKVNLNRAALIQKYFPQALKLYLKLHCEATLIEGAQTTLVEQSAQSPWFLQNWLDRPVVRVRSIRYWRRLEQFGSSGILDCADKMISNA